MSNLSIHSESQGEKSIKFFKIMFMGDSGVGKTSTLLKMTGDDFKDFVPSTIGVDFRWLSYKMSLRSNPLTLRFWDTAGQERFRSVAIAYIRSADAIILCFDVNDPDSLENVESWIREVETVKSNLTNVILVGCKDDLSLTVDLSHPVLSRFPWVTVSAKKDSPEDIQKKIMPLLHSTFSSLIESQKQEQCSPIELSSKTTYQKLKSKCCF